MQRPASLILIAFAAICANSSTSAQTFMAFRCSDGSQFEVAIFNSPREVTMQLDGKSLTLPRRLSLPTSTRYAKGGVTLTLNGQAATLKRSGAKTTACNAN